MNLDLKSHIEEIKKHVIFAGNTDDIRISLSNRMEYGSATVEYLQKEIQLEKKVKNRSTVIKLLESAIRKLQKKNG